MLNPNIDFGQLAIIGNLSVVGYFIRKEISNLNARLDKHDEKIIHLVGDVQRLIGIVSVSKRFGTRNTDHR